MSNPAPRFDSATINLQSAANKIRFFGGAIKGNIGHGVWSSAFEGRCTDVSFTGTEIAENGGLGLKGDVGIIGLSLVNCDVRNNTKAAAGIGVDLAPTADRPMENVTLIGNKFGGMTQTHALRTESSQQTISD